MGFLAVLLSLESCHPALVRGGRLAGAGSPRCRQGRDLQALPAYTLPASRPETSEGRGVSSAAANCDVSAVQNKAWSSLEQQPADWEPGTSEGSHKGASRGCRLAPARFLHGPNY